MGDQARGRWALRMRTLAWVSTLTGDQARIHRTDVLQWAVEAKTSFQEAQALEQPQRARRWKEWAHKADQGGNVRLGSWVKEEPEPPIRTVVKEGKVLVKPSEVVTEFANDWGGLWEAQEGVNEEVGDVGGGDAEQVDTSTRQGATQRHEHTTLL